MGWILPAREIQKALEQGLAEIHTLAGSGQLAPLVDRAFVSLTDAERADIVTYLGSREIPIVKNYPQTDAEFPVYSVVLMPHSPATLYLANVGGEQYRSEIGAITYAENADEVEWLNQLSTFMLARQRLELSSTVFPHALTFRTEDLGFERRFVEAGRLIYRRGTIVSAGYDQTEAEDESLLDITGQDFQETIVPMIGQ